MRFPLFRFPKNRSETSVSHGIRRPPTTQRTSIVETQGGGRDQISRVNPYSPGYHFWNVEDIFLGVSYPERHTVPERLGRGRTLYKE